MSDGTVVIRPKKRVWMTVLTVLTVVVVELLMLGILVYVHFGIHAFDTPRIQSQTQIQERKVEHIETVTQKVILNAQ